MSGKIKVPKQRYLVMRELLRLFGEKREGHAQTLKVKGEKPISGSTVRYTLYVLEEMGLAEKVGYVEVGRNKKQRIIWRLHYDMDMFEMETYEETRLRIGKEAQKPKIKYEYRHRFTPNDDEYIKNHWNVLPRSKIAERVGTTKTEINFRAIELGIAE